MVKLKCFKNKVKINKHATVILLRAIYDVVYCVVSLYGGASSEIDGKQVSYLREEERAD